MVSSVHSVRALACAASQASSMRRRSGLPRERGTRSRCGGTNASSREPARKMRPAKEAINGVRRRGSAPAGLSLLPIAGRRWGGRRWVVAVLV